MQNNGLLSILWYMYILIYVQCIVIERKAAKTYGLEQNTLPRKLHKSGLRRHLIQVSSGLEIGTWMKDILRMSLAPACTTLTPMTISPKATQR